MNIPLYYEEFPPSPKCDGCGECCKAIPGIYVPQQFLIKQGKLSVRKIGRLLPNLALDRWDADPTISEHIYFLRPATVSADSFMDFTWGGRCVHLVADGCALAREDMPMACKVLKPTKNPGCEPITHFHNSKIFAVLLWIPYQLELAQVLAKLGKKEEAKCVIDNLRESEKLHLLYDLLDLQDVTEAELEYIKALPKLYEKSANAAKKIGVNF